MLASKSALKSFKAPVAARSARVGRRTVFVQVSSISIRNYTVSWVGTPSQVAEAGH